jgi:plasmid stability protein
MTELLVRDVEPALVARLKQLADEHRRSVEDEHRAILREVLLAGGEEKPTKDAR